MLLDWMMIVAIEKLAAGKAMELLLLLQPIEDALIPLN